MAHSAQVWLKTQKATRFESRARRMVVILVVHTYTRRKLEFRVLSMILYVERDIARWLERGALLMSLPVVRFRIPFGAGFLVHVYGSVCRA